MAQTNKRTDGHRDSMTEKSRIQETTNLSTDADSITDTKNTQKPKKIKNGKK